MILTEEEVQQLRKLLNVKCDIKPPGPFDFKPQNWRKWKKRFRRYIKALEKSLENISPTELDEGVRVALLIFLLGKHAEETFLILERSGWSFQDTLKRTISRLNEHFKHTKKHDLYVRVNFHRRMQSAGQSVTEFVEAIKFLAEPCNFGKYYQNRMRDKMVIGINSDSARQKMIEFDDMLTFEKAVIIAFNEELRQARRPG